NHLLEQMERPRLVSANTTERWTSIAGAERIGPLSRRDSIVHDDSEDRQLSGETSLIRDGAAIRALEPRFVAIKKGEHGCLLFGPESFFSCGAYPLEDIHDPTGAGDSFAGGVAGYLASLNTEEVTFDQLRKAVVYGSVLASYNVEAFSLERL